jgi:RimJ/RimL family protein N-acetyltransferase
MIEVAMQRENLAVEPARFAPPYRLRGYRSGDEATWLALQQSTGVYPPLDAAFFRSQFGSAPEGRQFFVMRDRQPVATGTAWHGEPWRTPEWGRLHWIAVDPQHQRRGLGLMLCRHLLTVLRELGCVGAYLTTGSGNLPAVALYGKLGFVPWIRSPEEAHFWSLRADAAALDRLPLATPSLLIRRFAVADADNVLALSHEETWRTWLPSQAYRDRAHALSVLEFLIAQCSAPGNPRHGPYVLAIESRADRRLIGHVGFSPLDGEVEIGFSIAQSHQRQGLATEAIVAASRWVLRTFGLDRIVAVTSVANIGAKRTLGRAGFVHEGDRTMGFQGAVQDVSVYALSGSGGDERAT